MSTTTVYPSTADGYLTSGSDVSYATARSGGAVRNIHNTDGAMLVDQYKGGDGYFYCRSGYLDFDTSSIPDTDEISAVTLSLYAIQAYGSPGALEVYAYDWGEELTFADWIAGADVAAMTLLASYSGTWSGGAYRALTSETAFKAAINKTGVTRLFLCTTKFRTGSAPSDEDGYTFYATEKGTTYRPKLVIEHAPPAGVPKHSDYYRRRRAA